MEKYRVLKSYLIDTMTSFNSHGENLRKVIQGAYGKAGLEQRIEKLQSLGVRPSKPIEKTTSVQDEIMSFDTIEEKNKRPIKNSVKNLLDLEISLSLNKKKTFINFANNIQERKKELRNFIHKIKSQNKSIKIF